MSDGFVKLHRKFQQWGWYTDVNTKAVFIHLLINASYEDNEYRGHKIRAGQVVTGLHRLSKDLKISVQSVRTALNHLKSTNEITIKTTSKFSVITIENWGKYQGFVLDGNQQLTNNQQADSAKKHEKYKKSTSKLTSNQPATPIEISSNTAHVQPATNKQANKQLTNNQQTTNNTQESKESKESKEYKEYNNIYSPAEPNDEPDSFSENYKEIIAYLNETCGTAYRASSKATQRVIHARLNEGFTVEDFKTVIYKKAKQWKDDTKMCAYLRPQTLFGTKFESYLNEKEALNAMERWDSA